MSKMQVTDEATRAGVELGADVGSAFRRSVEHFVSSVAQTGGQTTAGDFEIAVAAEEAEPLYEMRGGELQLAEPGEGENAHLEVVVMDAADGRFVPQLEVTVTLSRQDREVGTWKLPFLWHPTMYHYGRNVRIPEPGGEYSMLVAVEPPTFGRHDRQNGRRYAEPVAVSFDGLRIEGGRKR